MYRDDTETLREELRQTSAELARVSAELMKRDARLRTEIQYRDHGGVYVHDWVVIAIALLGVVALSTFVAAITLERGVAAAWVVCVLSTSTMLRIWWRALPRVEVKR